MKLNAVYFLNVIDAHLAKLAGIDFSFKDASLDKIVADVNGKEATTCGMKRDALMANASRKNDAFAKAFLNGENWQNDYRAFGFIQDARNTLAHGGKLTQESVDMMNELIPGYDFDVDGNFTLSADMEAAFALIKTTVKNDVDHLAGFRRLEVAACELASANGVIYQTTAKYVIRRFQNPRNNDLAKSLCRRLWKANNIRNRYAHTGRLTTAERAFCEKLASDLNTTF